MIRRKNSSTLIHLQHESFFTTRHKKVIDRIIVFLEVVFGSILYSFKLMMLTEFHVLVDYICLNSGIFMSVDR